MQDELTFSDRLCGAGVTTMVEIGFQRRGFAEHGDEPVGVIRVGIEALGQRRRQVEDARVRHDQEMVAARPIGIA